MRKVGVGCSRRSAGSFESSKKLIWDTFGKKCLSLFRRTETRSFAAWRAVAKLRHGLSTIPASPPPAARYVFGIVLVLVWLPLHWLGSVGAVGGVRVRFRKIPPFCVPGIRPVGGHATGVCGRIARQTQQHGAFSELCWCWCGCHCIGWARWMRWVVCGCDLVRFLTPILAPMTVR